MNFTMYVILFLAGSAGVFCLLWQISSKKTISLKSELLQVQLLKGQVEADNEALLKYMAGRKELDKIQREDLKRFQEAPEDEKHMVTADILDALYS